MVVVLDRYTFPPPELRTADRGAEDERPPARPPLRPATIWEDPKSAANTGSVVKRDPANNTEATIDAAILLSSFIDSEVEARLAGTIGAKAWAKEKPTNNAANDLMVERLHCLGSIIVTGSIIFLDDGG